LTAERRKRKAWRVNEKGCTAHPGKKRNADFKKYPDNGIYILHGMNVLCNKNNAKTGLYYII